MHRYAVALSDGRKLLRLRMGTAVAVLMILGFCNQASARSLVEGAPAGALAPTGASMVDGDNTLAPQGWLDFCARGGSDPLCNAVVLTPARAAQLQDVEASIRKIRRRTDQQLYGVAEFWTVADQKTGGDCEDIALAAREQLLGLGWPSSALRLATAWTEQNDFHLVLTVDVFINDVVQTLVIDSRFPRLQTYSGLTNIGYRFQTRQAALGAGWVKIQAPSLPKPQIASLQLPTRLQRTATNNPAAKGSAAAASVEVRLTYSTIDDAQTAPNAMVTGAPAGVEGTATNTEYASITIRAPAFFPLEEAFGQPSRFGPLRFFF